MLVDEPAPAAVALILDDGGELTVRGRTGRKVEPGPDRMAAEAVEGDVPALDRCQHRLYGGGRRPRSWRRVSSIVSARTRRSQPAPRPSASTARARRGTGP